MALDKEYFHRSRRQMMQSGPLAEKFLWWQAKLRGTFHNFFRPMLSHLLNVGSLDYDWRSYQDNDWLLVATDAERVAYRRGAEKLAGTIIRILETAADTSIDSIVDAMHNGEDIEEKIADLITESGAG